MPFQHQTHEIKFGRSYTFKFAEGAVGQYLLGISEFHIQFNVGKTKNGAYEVQQMGISLSHNLTNQGVTVYVDGTLLNHQDDFFDRGRSHATVVILAWIGDGDYDFTLTNANNISNGAFPISVRHNPSTSLAVLSGFNFSFGNKSTALNKVDVQILTQGYNAAARTVTARVDVQISGERTAESYAGDCGLFAIYEASESVHATTYDSIDSGKTKSFYPPLKGKTTYVAFMTGFSIAYGGSLSIPLSFIKAGIAVDADGNATVHAGMTGSRWESSGGGEFKITNLVVYGSSKNRVSGITLGYSLLDAPAAHRAGKLSQ